MRESGEKGIFSQPAFYLGIMFLIITAQVFWWLMFFADTRFALVRAQDELDAILLKALNGETAGLEPRSYFLRDGDVYRMDPSVIASRRSERDHNLIMLRAEASFFIFVFGGGAIILMRLHRKQRRLARERELFLSSFTHELKTPLAAIKLNLQTLRRRPDTSSRDELLETSLGEVEILNRRISEILLGGALSDRTGKAEVAERDERQVPLIRSESAGPALATHVLENVLRDLVSTLRETKGKIRAAWLPPVHGAFRLFLLSGAPLPAPVLDAGIIADERGLRGDAFQRLRDLDLMPVRYGELELGMILSGLVTNALVHGASGDGVDVSVLFRLTDRYLTILIADRGPGIPWRQRHNVFRPLVRLQQKQGFLPGTGMGLFNLRELCRKGGGQVRLRPSSKGAVFEVRLPFAKRERSP